MSQGVSILLLLVQDFKMNNTVVIYSLSDPKTGVVKYIGKTSKTLTERMRSHIKDAKRKNNKRTAWIKSILKLGLNPIIEVIDEVPVEDWQFWEIYWIEQFKAWGFKLKNGTIGGDGTKGYVYTDEDKKKMRGKVLSKETREKMSKAKKGKPCPWNKIYGKNHHRFKVKHSEETKDKMKKPVIQFDRNGNVIKNWKGLQEAENGTGVSCGNISRTCNGKRKSAGGFLWKYK